MFLLFVVHFSLPSHADSPRYPPNHHRGTRRDSGRRRVRIQNYTSFCSISGLVKAECPGIVREQRLLKQHVARTERTAIPWDVRLYLHCIMGLAAMASGAYTKPRPRNCSYLDSQGNLNSHSPYQQY